MAKTPDSPPLRHNELQLLVEQLPGQGTWNRGARGLRPNRGWKSSTRQEGQVETQSPEGAKCTGHRTESTDVWPEDGVAGRRVGQLGLEATALTPIRQQMEEN